MKKLILILTLLISLLFPYTVMADTHAAASCAAADIQDAVDLASNGDTVTVPATGSPCTWNSKLTLDLTTKGLLIQGAGSGLVTIVSATPLTDPTLEILVASGYPVTLTGFTFDGDDRNNTSASGIVNFTGTGTGADHRIHHNAFINIGDRGILFTYSGGELYGLIDNNTFTSTGIGGEMAISAIGNGSTSWSIAHTWGDANAIYIEDNTFNWSRSSDDVIDGYNGARFVIRYNHFYERGVGFHGNLTGGYRSVFSTEIYENDIDQQNASQGDPINVKGGSHTIYNNRITGNFKQRIFAQSGRSCSSATTWGKCDGSNPYDLNEVGSTGTSGTATAGGATSMVHAGAGWEVNAYVDYYVHNTSEGTATAADCMAKIESNTSDTLTLVAGLGSSCSGNSQFANTETYVISLGYPCLDQLGRGTNQATDKSYEWNNTEDETEIDWLINNPCAESTPDVLDHLTVGVDLINDTERPAYTPYTYPHPLRQEGEGEASGTIIPGGCKESEIVTGGKYIDLELEGEEWPAAGEAFDAIRQDLIDGLDSAQAEAAGWDAVVKAELAVTTVTRIDDDTARITLPDFDGDPNTAYEITANETITSTICDTCTVGQVEIVCGNTFQISAEQIGAETIGCVYDATGPAAVYDANGPTVN